MYLGSTQKEALSNSGTIKVAFRCLAMATMSHICTRIQNEKIRDLLGRAEKQKASVHVKLTAALIWLSPPLQETMR